MEKDIWLEVKAHYERFHEISEQEQEALLAELDRTKPEVAQILRNLITEKAETDPALENPAMSKIREVESPTDLVGQTIGKYKLTYLIGVGGMGKVYLADRMDLEAHQQVAIKIISAGLLSDVYKKRFDRERKILSRLNHPHITRIYDGGISESGLPYIIMEYVQGMPLMEHVNENKLDLNQRLELFLDLCDAVNYAHSNFVMHRDLKPGNILVTQHGIVKVIDFGIAKILEDEDAEEDLTMMGYIPLTPAYASPEQLKGKPLTTLSDVYSLGVILYELLTSKKPFPGSTKSNLALAERIQHKADATKPSSSVDPSVTTDLKSWCKELKGDLDNIALKALKENPGERYSSAEQLAEDIRRYQNDYPVIARADSVAYRLKKYTQRNQSLVIVGALLVFILLGGITATLWQANKVAYQRDQAKYEAEKAKEITTFIIDLFDHSDPDRARGEVITSENMLDAGSKKLSELDGKPALQAEMYRVVGNLYRKQNNFEKAELHLDKARTLFQEVLGPDHLEVAQTEVILAELFAFQNRTEETLDASTHASMVFRSELGAGSREYVRAENYVARGELQQGDYTKALERMLRVQAEAEKKWNNPDAAQSGALVSLYNDIGSAYNALNDRENYMVYLQKALVVMRNSQGEIHQNVAALYNNIGHGYFFEEQYDSSKFYCLKALEIADKVYRGKPNDRSQFAHCSLAKIYVELGDLNEAMKHAEGCHAMSRDLYGPAHMATGRGLSIIADVHIAKGDIAASEPYREEATLTYEAFFGGEDPMLAWHYWDEADRYYQSGDLKNAIVYKRQCIDMYLRTMPEEVDDLAEARHILAQYLIENKTPAEAPELLEQSLAYYIERYGEADERAQAVSADLATAYQRTGRVRRTGGNPEAY